MVRLFAGPAYPTASLQISAEVVCPIYSSCVTNVLNCLQFLSRYGKSFYYRLSVFVVISSVCLCGHIVCLSLWSYRLSVFVVISSVCLCGHIVCLSLWSYRLSVFVVISSVCLCGHIVCLSLWSYRLSVFVVISFVCLCGHIVCLSLWSCAVCLLILSIHLARLPLVSLHLQSVGFDTGGKRHERETQWRRDTSGRRSGDE